MREWCCVRGARSRIGVEGGGGSREIGIGYHLFEVRIVMNTDILI